jgi:phosphoglycerate dehydrogenase-like enzyme
MNKPRVDRLVYVGPDRDDTVAEAVRATGARTVDTPAEADVFVWLSPSVGELRAVLHPGVEWVQFKSAGVEHVLESGVIDAERHWTSARGAYADAVAEHGITLMLAAARRLHEIIGSGEWGAPGTRFGRLLSGATVGIIGCGAIGRALIALLAAFKVRVLAVTRSGRSVEGAVETLEAGQADKVIEVADFVVLTAPSTPQTVGFMDQRRFDVMRDDAWLVNIARGDLVVTDDLVVALKQGMIGGAALDVTDPEPLPPSHSLWQVSNVIITPHTANPPEANSITLAQRVVDNLKRLKENRPLVGTIDAVRGY